MDVGTAGMRCRNILRDSRTSGGAGVIARSVLPGLAALLVSSGSLGAAEPPTLRIAVRPAELVAPGGEMRTLDLQTVLDLAARENLDSRFSVAVAEAAEEEREASNARWWPTFTVSALARHTDGTVQGTVGDIETTVFSTALASAILRWELNPAATHLRSRTARQAAAAAVAGSEAARLRAQLAAATQYAQLLGAAGLATVARQTRDDAAEFLRLTRLLEEKGLGLGVDVQRARAELARRQQVLAETQEAFRLASIRLAETLNIDPGTVILPADEAIGPPELPGAENLEELTSKGLSGRPESRSTAQDVAAAESRLAALRWDAHGPGVSVELQQGWLGKEFPEARERSVYSAQVGWSFAPYQIGEVHAAHARLDAARLSQQRTLQRIRAEVAASREAVQLSRQRLVLAAEALDAAQNALRISRLRFEQGIGNTLEVLQAQDVLAAARAEAVSVIVDAHRAVFELRHAVGGPIGAP